MGAEGSAPERRISTRVTAESPSCQRHGNPPPGTLPVFTRAAALSPSSAGLLDRERSEAPGVLDCSKPGALPEARRVSMHGDVTGACGTPRLHQALFAVGPGHISVRTGGTGRGAH